MCRWRRDHYVSVRYIDNIELEISERKPGSMQTLSEGYARGGASEYQATNGKYTYTFVDALYGSLDAGYLLMEMAHRGFDVPWLNESSLAHHTFEKSLTVSHSSKGDLAYIQCQDDSHFVGEPHEQAQYIHILRDVTDTYRVNKPDTIAGCHAATEKCLAIYQDYKKEFALVYFPPVENSAFVNDTVYLIKMANGAMAQFPFTELVVGGDTIALSKEHVIYLTLDGQQTVIEIKLM
ncbi:hypothetical protein ACPV4B_18080 [Vibrio parahaemolyticus]|uniref:hypothetical protein n=2 Tax=Vibrio mediterranei TaxID=689 RepID=UPI004068BCA2